MRALDVEGWTPRKLERGIAASPGLGATREEVEEWLVKFPFRRVWVNHFEDVGIAKEVGLGLKDIGEVLISEVPNVHVDLWKSNGTMDVYWLFDKQDRLLGRHVRVWVESL
ncbi:hypothetical protein ACYOEI_01485 [Singulisphaera rosea]